jgi:uncharacterized NAD-dependent epimerase/dehydratase family protein
MSLPEGPGFDGNALVWCENAYQTANGKTAHGLVRFTRRYGVTAVIDSTCAGLDAGQVLDGTRRDIPIVADLETGLSLAKGLNQPVDRLVVGLAPDGGKADDALIRAVWEALDRGLSVDSGLHTLLSEIPELKRIAAERGVQIRDIRRAPDVSALHFFSGEIETVGAYRFALLGTDSAIGKRTSAWMLVWALEQAGFTSELIGTGQTAWLQGARYGVLMDALVNDFVSGEIEHAVCRAWKEIRPQTLVIEGQGSLLNPAYPGGFEILAAGRPQAVILQHAPKRRDYDGFPGYTLHPLDRQIAAVEAVYGRRPAAITLNQEGMRPEEIEPACETIEGAFGIPCLAPLVHGFAPLVSRLRGEIEARIGTHV